MEQPTPPGGPEAPGSPQEAAGASVRGFVLGLLATRAVLFIPGLVIAWYSAAFATESDRSVWLETMAAWVIVLGLIFQGLVYAKRFGRSSYDRNVALAAGWVVAAGDIGLFAAVLISTWPISAMFVLGPLFLLPLASALQAGLIPKGFVGPTPMGPAHGAQQVSR